MKEELRAIMSMHINLINVGTYSLQKHQNLNPFYLFCETKIENDHLSILLNVRCGRRKLPSPNRINLMDLKC